MAPWRLALRERRWDVDRAWLRKVRPWWGHDAHFHVRLRCPPGDDCHAQSPPPPGEGCGAPVEAWLEDMREAMTAPPKPKPDPVIPDPPARCQALLEG